MTTSIRTLALLILLCWPTILGAQKLPDGDWPVEKSQPILDKTQEVRLAPNLSHLSDGERKAVGKLLEVGKIFQALYEQQRDATALVSLRALEALDKA